MTDTTAPEETIDWQHPEVKTRLVAWLKDELRGWRSDWIASATDTRVESDLTRALDYCGERIDGYEMGKYLEISRQWPMDAGAVHILHLATSHRIQIIGDVKRERTPKTERAEGDWQVGDFFSVENDYRVFQITAIDRNRSYEVHIVCGDGANYDVSFDWLKNRATERRTGYDDRRPVRP